MENTLPLEEQSISQVYFDSQEPCVYQIPIYQRNYAWEEDEITDLIKDVYDSYRKDKTAPYYIGTLVTYKRGDNVHEVIDGQQRLTTIYIILKALGKDSIRNKLTYTARHASAETIKNLPNFGDEVDLGIRHGYSYASNALCSVIDKEDLISFEHYFLHYVHIIHYSVPKDVDLNHYFEVMNSRGEQLEKHEIVKSELSQALNDKGELAKFSRVWEACSEMNVFIQHRFQYESVFGKNYDYPIIDDFSQLPDQNLDDGKSSIMDLLSGSTEGIDSDGSSVSNDNFQPIIDFPNFLLIVLKLTLIGTDGFDPKEFILDDKELLNEFEKAIKASDDKAEFTREFAYNLLWARYFLDNYIVHHSLNDREQKGDNPWHVEYYYYDKKQSHFYPKNLLGDNTTEQHEIVHLLSMFEVAFTAKQRKNYLFYCLIHLFEDPDENHFLTFLRQLADKYFFDVYLNGDGLNERNQPVPNAFDNTILVGDKLNLELDEVNDDIYEIFDSIYTLGSREIPLFVFNYMDYRIWKKYADELRGTQAQPGSKKRNEFFAKLGCSDFGLDVFNDFYFSRTRKSLEHYYPQAKAVRPKDLTENTVSTEQINCFGNFAMIGADANSSGSDLDPNTKFDRYLDGKSDQVSVASLKFRIMLQKCRDNLFEIHSKKLDRQKGMEWNYDDMQEHQEKMTNILFESYGQTE